MRGLSILQPWASLIAIGAKRVETRSWPTAYRGPVAIHASKKFTADDRLDCWDEIFRDVLGPANLVDYANYDDLPIDAIERFRLPLGAIIAVARLVDVVSTNDDRACAERMEPHSAKYEHAFGDYSENRYGWLLADVRALRKPIPYRGALGLWTIPDNVLKKIERAYA